MKRKLLHIHNDWIVWVITTPPIQIAWHKQSQRGMPIARNWTGTCFIRIGRLELKYWKRWVAMWRAQGRAPSR